MSYLNDIDYRLLRLTHNSKVTVRPDLRLNNAGNIQKVYNIIGFRDERESFIDKAQFYGYHPCNNNTYTIAQNVSMYVPDDAEAEEIDKLLESDADWSTILEKLTEFVENYYFDEESYYIEIAYTMQGDCIADVYKNFDDKDELLEWLQDYVREEVEFYTENVHGYFRTADECKEWNLIPDLVHWANGILVEIDAEWKYSADKMVNNLVQEWKKQNELIY